MWSRNRKLLKKNQQTVISHKSAGSASYVFYFLCCSINGNSDKTLFIAFINCYILSPKSPQTLENTKFIASEFALRLSLMLYPFPSCYELS